MPDEYGLPTAEEYAAEQEQLDKEERRARTRENVTQGAKYGSQAGLGLSFVPGLGWISPLVGGAVGAGVGLVKTGIQNIAGAREETAESMRERRLRALLRRAELGELVDPQELAAIEQKFMDPYLAKQRDVQQAALNRVASQDMGAGGFARAQQAQAATQAEETLIMAEKIENQRRMQEEAERRELAALVEGDIEGAQAAAEKAGKDAQAAFESFIESTTQLADPEFEKQWKNALGLNEDATSAENKVAKEDASEWGGKDLAHRMDMLHARYATGQSVGLVR